MSQAPDMTKKQFLAALERNGMKPGLGFLGYVDVGDGVNVSRLNAGPRYRDQLAYLLKQRQFYRAMDNVNGALSDELAAMFGISAPRTWQTYTERTGELP